MTTYRLHDDGFPYKKIVTGRKWIGRVCKCADGTYLGIIGKDMVKECRSEREAFDRVVAMHCGYSSPEHMDESNERMRAARRASKERANQVFNAMMRGDYEPFADMLQELDKDMK